MEQSLLTFPTWEKYIVISNTIESLRVKDKRLIFHTLRKHPEATKDYFFPGFGFTTSEFACWQILTDGRKHRKKNVMKNSVCIKQDSSLNLGSVSPL